MFVVISMVGVLMVLGLNALADTTRRMATGAALDEIHSVLRVIRREARVRSAPVVFRIEPDEEHAPRLRYLAFVDPTFMEGSWPDPPEEENDERWLARGLLPPELGLAVVPDDPNLPPPFNSLVGDSACTFCESGDEALQLVFLSDDVVSLGNEPQEHLRGGSFTLGRWVNSQQRVDKAAPIDHHLYVLLGRTGGVHRFTR